VIKGLVSTNYVQHRRKKFKLYLFMLYYTKYITSDTKCIGSVSSPQ